MISNFVQELVAELEQSRRKFLMNRVPMRPLTKYLELRPLNKPETKSSVLSYANFSIKK